MGAMGYGPTDRTYEAPILTAHLPAAPSLSIYCTTPLGIGQYTFFVPGFHAHSSFPYSHSFITRVSPTHHTQLTLTGVSSSSSTSDQSVTVSGACDSLINTTVCGADTQLGAPSASCSKSGVLGFCGLVSVDFCSFGVLGVLLCSAAPRVLLCVLYCTGHYYIGLSTRAGVCEDGSSLAITLTEPLGAGSFGVVMRGVLCGRSVAVKIIPHDAHHAGGWLIAGWLVDR